MVCSGCLPDITKTLSYLLSQGSNTQNTQNGPNEDSVLFRVGRTTITKQQKIKKDNKGKCWAELYPNGKERTGWQLLYVWM